MSLSISSQSSFTSVVLILESIASLELSILLLSLIVRLALPFQL